MVDCRPEVQPAGLAVAQVPPLFPAESLIPLIGHWLGLGQCFAECRPGVEEARARVVPAVVVETMVVMMEMEIARGILVKGSLVV